MLALAGNAPAQKAAHSPSRRQQTGVILNVPDAAFIGRRRRAGHPHGARGLRGDLQREHHGDSGITSAAVQLALVAHCQNLASRFAVLDMPCDMVKPQELLKHRAIIDSDYAAMYHPWLQVYDMAAKKAGLHPALRRGLRHLRPQRQHPRRPQGSGQRGRQQRHGSELPLQQGRAGPLKSGGRQPHPGALPGQGIRVWGGRTCSSNSLWKYVNVRRLFIFLEETIKAQTNWAVFEPNDEVLWLRVQRTIASFLRDMYRSGALVGATEDEAFFVNIGHDTMTQSDILNGRLICVIGVAPSRPAEFVIFRITQNMRE